MSSWDAEGLALAVDEVRALCAMYDDGDDAATGADATSVDDPSVLLDLAESALSAAFPPPGASSSSVDPLAAVPALETTVRLLGARLRGGPVAVALTFPPGFPRVARLGAHVEGNARATLADLATLRAAAASAVEAVGLGEPGSAVSAVEAVRCAVEDARRSEDRRRDDEAGEEAAGSPDASAPAAAAAEEEAGSRIARRLIWFHHIKAPSKRRDAKAWAKELALGGFVKPGYRGHPRRGPPRRRRRVRRQAQAAPGGKRWPCASRRRRRARRRAGRRGRGGGGGSAGRSRALARRRFASSPRREG